MENKKSFILYADLIKVVDRLPDDVAGKLFKIVLKYVNDEEVCIDDILLEIAFEPIKNQLKRDLKKWENLKEKRSKAGKLGGRPKKIENQTVEKTADEEAKEANAFFDKQVEAKKAVNDNVTVTVNDTVNDTVTVTDILLKKETKTEKAGVCDEIPNLDFKNSEIEEKEKSSAKKEKEIQDLRSSDFFKQLCAYFSQTNEVLQMRAFGDLCRLHDMGQLQDFIKQTKAYMAYKQLTGEKAHRFQNFIYEWKNDDWVNKLKKQQNHDGKSVNNSSSGKGYKPAYADTDKLVRELESDFENGNIPGVY